MTTPTDKIDEPDMTIQQRWTGLYKVVLLLGLLAFFVYHQMNNTGFFTDAFGWQEMVALYVPIIIAMGPPIQRFIQGKRNASRLLEAISDLSLALGSVWLWNHYPFDFSHLADPFPPAMQPYFEWINDKVGRFILLLQVVLGFISGLATMVNYVREQRTATPSGN
jgi:hypothetical protein